MNKEGMLSRLVFIFAIAGVLMAVCVSMLIAAQEPAMTFGDIFNVNDVNLVNASESGLSRGYTPTCDDVGGGLHKCHLTLEFKAKSGIDTVTLENTDFTYLFNTLKGSPIVKASGYDVLDGVNWVTLESVDVVAGESFYVDLWAEIEGEDWEVDALPCIFGDCDSLSHFAIWTSYESEGNTWLGGASDFVWAIGQTFTVGGTGTFTVANVSMMLNLSDNNYTDLVADIPVFIESVGNDNAPNGSILATCTPVSKSAFASLQGDDLPWIETPCTFTGQKGTKYFLDFNYTVQDDCKRTMFYVYDSPPNIDKYPDGSHLVWATTQCDLWGEHCWYPPLEYPRDGYFRIDDTWEIPNTAPLFEPIAGFSLSEDFGSYEINLSDNVSDAETLDIADFTYSWSMNDTGIVTIHIENETGNMSFTSIQDKFGSVEVSVTVNDGGLVNSTNSTAFVLTVESVNDVPTHAAPKLEATTAYNTTEDTLYCYNQSTYDADGDTVYNIFSWLKNGSPFEALNMPFDTGTKDYSGNSNDGVLNSSEESPTLTDGKSGNAYLFDGTDDFIRISSSSLFDSEPGKTMTFSMWIKSDDYGPRQTILSRRHPCNNNGHFLIFTQGNRVYFSFYPKFDSSLAILS